MAVSSSGSEPALPWSKSTINVVFTWLPSLFHNSRPVAGCVATKYTTLLITAKSVGIELSAPGAMSFTSTVPCGVPFVRHNLEPVCPIVRTEKKLSSGDRQIVQATAWRSWIDIAHQKCAGVGAVARPEFLTMDAVVHDKVASVVERHRPAGCNSRTRCDETGVFWRIDARKQ